ncbi:MAG: Rpn family recombination-promoting nuclease/putative transposase [Chitinophagaceae bacterium]|jgi:predicted transposase/invertase (TIGR01784 family)|nr:Rpn family recombination-promoting nuclease/putative transposase [Chitinophagaceae bacterium]
MSKTKNNKDIALPIGRYIDLLTDFGFKLIFGTERNKDVLIAFLNELFKGRKVIRDIIYNPQEKKGPVKDYRSSSFDITCTGANGETFIVEMQRANQKFFTDRAIYYTATKLHEQGPKGKKNWDFELKEVYFIAIMDFNFENIQPDKYLHYVRLADEETGKIFYDKLGYIFIELPNFNIEEKDIKTNLECWLFVLRNMWKVEKISVFLREKIFQKLFQIAEIANLKKEEYIMYEKDLMDKWTEYSVLKTAKERGREEGMEKGIEKGMEQKSYEVVANLIIKLGLNDEQAANIADVPVATVKKIRASLKKKK